LLEVIDMVVVNIHTQNDAEARTQLVRLVEVKSTNEKKAVERWVLTSPGVICFPFKN
jgi:hypothetical protein